MSAEETGKSTGPENEEKAPAFNTGNASNPAADDDSFAPSPGSQLLDEKAEKYLREVASIEDVPDAQDQKEMDETLKQNQQEDQQS
jgi:hypothetical protein